MNDHEKWLKASREFWDNEAVQFDNEPYHGLSDPIVREAWKTLLKQSLPQLSSTILDIGCGTGSLSIVLVELGHTVTGIDLSPAMISVAQEKAQVANCQIKFSIMDATFPQFPTQQFDVIICRHLLWALSKPDQVLERWVNLLKAGGNLVLIEGYWQTGGGLHAPEIVDCMPTSMTNIAVMDLSNQPDLWGKVVVDERYIISARKQT